MASGTIELYPSTTHITGLFNFLDSAGLESTALYFAKCIQIEGYFFGLSHPGSRKEKIRERFEKQQQSIN